MPMLINYLMVGSAFFGTGLLLGWSMCRAWIISEARAYRQAAEERAARLADLQLRMDAYDSLSQTGKR